MDTSHLVGVDGSNPIYKMKLEARWLAEETVEDIVKGAGQKAM